MRCSFGPDALARLGATQPLAQPVPADDAFYLQSQGRAHVAWRTLRRMLALQASGQRATLHSRIDPRWTRALWIHAEAPQIGDALMDLAPRSLLAARGMAVDVLAAAPIAELLTGDRWLRQSFSDPAAIDPARYDFVVATSHSAESLAAKRRHAPRLPWISLKGYYSAYDYHRGCFAARRLAELLEHALDDAAYRFHSRQKLAVRASSAARLEPGAGSPEAAPVAIAVGGVHAQRSYAHWPAVAGALCAGGVRTLVLLGNANGRSAASRIVAAAPPELVVRDLTDRTDLPGARAEIARARIVLCADGGLMHLAFTTATPVIALFTRPIDPAWRVPLDLDGTCLRSGSADVSEIGADVVAAAALRIMRR